MKNNLTNDYLIEVTVTNSCNCNCKYCFENDHCDNSSLEEQELQLTRISELCESIKEENGSLTICFWGGEPMMNTDYLFSIIDNTYRYEFVRYNMYSNGTLVDRFEKLVSQFWFPKIKDRFHIQLSYDGEPHNTLMRGYGGENIFKTADILIENGMKPSFKATLSLDKLDLLPEIWLSYYDLSKRYDFIDYSPTLDTTNDNIEYLDVWEKSLKEIIKYELAFLKKHERPLWNWFRNQRKINCGTSNRLHIHNDGNVYICHGCPYVTDNYKFILGNTQKDKLKNLFVINEDKSNHECKKCDAIYCSVCHVQYMTDCQTPDEVYDKWSSCRTKNENRCKYYRLFAKYSRVLKTAYNRS